MYLTLIQKILLYSMHFRVAGFKNSFTDHFYFCAGLRVTLLI